MSKRSVQKFSASIGIQKAFSTRKASSSPSRGQNATVKDTDQIQQITGPTSEDVSFHVNLVGMREKKTAPSPTRTAEVKNTIGSTKFECHALPNDSSIFCIILLQPLSPNRYDRWTKRNGIEVHVKSKEENRRPLANDGGFQQVRTNWDTIIRGNY